MNTTCPACTKAVDPLRSRFVGVRDGKVVAFCSAECAAKGASAAATQPVVPTRTATPPAGVPARDISAGPPRPNTPPPGVPVVLDSGPVIEITREASSRGVPVATPARADRTEPRAKHPDEIPIAAFWTADKEKSGAVRMPGDAVPPVAVAKDKSVPVKAPVLPTPRVAVEPEPELDQLAPVRKSRAPLMLILLVLIVAGGFAVYRFLISTPAAEPAPEPAPPHAVVEPPPPPPVVSPEALVDQARTALATAMTATSPRVSRLAAEALARTDDPHALDLLGRQLGLKPQAASVAGAGSAAGSGSAGSGSSGSAGSGSAASAAIVETSDIARLDLAYALARGHDKRGSDALGAALASQRAEVRDEAARLLALLGDARAVPHLTDLLQVSQRRLGAAEHLAHLAEPHAIKALEQLRADPKTSVDDRARATIALGVAGHADVAPALREMLADPHFNAFAAAALAELKDRAAQPVLVRQLESPALRVRAARALRRLAPTLDPHPLVAPLLDVLRSGRDTDQVQAAEAVLLLCGPLAWSTFE